MLVVVYQQVFITVASLWLKKEEKAEEQPSAAFLS